jgi:hypothetical protein
MDLSKFKTILYWSFIVMLLHTVEESITKLWNFDPFMIYMSAHFPISGVGIYFTVQTLVMLLIFVLILLALKNKFNKPLVILLGLIFILELLHPYNSLRIWGYYSGLYTGLALLIVGYFYRRELLKSKLIFNT